jgi:cytochrome c-type biogenesis protein CcmH
MADRARRLLAALALAAAPVLACAQAGAPAASAPAAVPTAADPALEARMLAITSELRCLVCQNQTIADSHADLAADLRKEVRELLRQGRSDAEIRAYMTARYGDFVLYRPPLKATTAALWLGPAVLLAIALAALAATIARRRRLADDRFEPDPAWDDDADLRDADAGNRTGTPA